MTEMFGEAWSPMSVPDLAPDDDDDEVIKKSYTNIGLISDHSNQTHLFILLTFKVSLLLIAASLRLQLPL